MKSLYPHSVILKPTGKLRQFLLPLYSTILIIGSISKADVQAQASPDESDSKQICQTVFSQVQTTFEKGFFDNTIKTLRQSGCLSPSNADKANLIDAYEVLASSYIAIHNPDSAQLWVRALVELQPTYRSLSEVNSWNYTKMLQREKRKWTLYRWSYRGKKPHHWLFRLGIVGGAYLLTRPPPPDLEGPPNLPVNP